MSKHNQVNWGSDETIDSRGINEHLAELESEFEGLELYLKEAQDNLKEFCGDNDISTDKPYEELKILPIEDETIKAELLELISDVEEAETNLESFDSDELKLFREITEEGSEYVQDWTHGEVLIHERYFTEYAQELAEDVGAIDGTEKWPLNCIDWEEAARQLQQDYTTIDAGGETYYVRP